MLFDIDIRCFLDGIKGAKRVLYNNWSEIVNIPDDKVDEVYKFMVEGEMEV